MAHINGVPGISRTEYEMGVEKRLMPRSLEVGSELILRMLAPKGNHPAYAIEAFARVLEITDEPQGAVLRTFALECDKPRSRIETPMSRDGFMMVVDTTEDLDAGRPEGLVRAGYFLGSTILDDEARSFLANATADPPTNLAN